MANGKELVFTIDLSEFRKIGLLADGLETEVADAIYMAIREGLPTVRQQISDAAPRSKYAQYVDRQPGHRIANQVRLGAVVRTGNDVEGTIRTGKATIFTLPPGTKAHYIHVKDDTRWLKYFQLHDVEDAETGDFHFAKVVRHPGVYIWRDWIKTTLRRQSSPYISSLVQKYLDGAVIKAIVKAGAS